MWAGACPTMRMASGVPSVARDKRGRGEKILRHMFDEQNRPKG